MGLTVSSFAATASVTASSCGWVSVCVSVTPSDVTLALIAAVICDLIVSTFMGV